jgi:hypothetical protein
MRALVIALVAATTLGGCTTFSRQFAYSFPANGNLPELPVVLTDATASVTSVGAAPAGFQPIVNDGFSTVANNPNAIVVHWLGGACDASIAITADGSNNVDFTVTTATKPGGCDAIGIPRAVLIQLSRPADPSRLGVRFDRP